MFEESQVMDKDKMSVEFFGKFLIGQMIRKGARALPQNLFSGMNEERTRESGEIPAGRLHKFAFAAHHILWFSEWCISSARCTRVKLGGKQLNERTYFELVPLF